MAPDPDARPRAAALAAHELAERVRGDPRTWLDLHRSAMDAKAARDAAFGSLDDQRTNTSFDAATNNNNATAANAARPAATSLATPSGAAFAFSF